MEIKNELQRILIILAIALVSHLVVLVLKRVHKQVLKSKLKAKSSKWQSITSLGVSILIFIIYFVALGKILQEFGVSLTTYFASASVIGLAVAFGSQGIVQDVVTGVTVVFSDLLDIGELIEVGGQAGFVEGIGMRFVTIRNANKAVVNIPNRTLMSVINYPKGHMQYYLDLRIPQTDVTIKEVDALVSELVKAYEKQYPNYFLEPSSVRKLALPKDKDAGLRIIFRMWPNRFTVVDANFKPELLTKLKILIPDYPDWMVSIAAEVE